MKTQECQQCGRTYQTFESRVGRSKFCSKACANDAMKTPRGKCLLCGGQIPQTKETSRNRFCSKKCANRWTAKHRKTTKHRLRTPKGYILLLMPLHPRATKAGYIMEHRAVMERSIGRLLEPGEVVHHKNGKKDDNRIENLELMAKAEHDRQPKVRRPIVCPRCGHVIARSKYAWDAEPICPDRDQSDPE